MTNAIENLKAAINGLTTAEEIWTGYDLLKARNGYIAATAVLTFHPGDTVSFRGKHGVHLSGEILDVNRKTVTVLADDGRRWRVAPSLLTRTLPNLDL